MHSGTYQVLVRLRTPFHFRFASSAAWETLGLVRQFWAVVVGSGWGLATGISNTQMVLTTPSAFCCGLGPVVVSVPSYL